MANTRMALASSNLEGIGTPGNKRRYCRALLRPQTFHPEHQYQSTWSIQITELSRRIRRPKTRQQLTDQ